MVRRLTWISCPALVFVALAYVGSPVNAETWPQFRGSTGDGASRETNLPVRWSEGEGVLWATPLPGRANSSPAVTEKRIDLTTQTDDKGLWVLSFDRASGKLLRQTRVGQGTLAAKGPANLYVHRHNAATPTPVADEEHVWAFYGTGLMVCVEASTGTVRWRRDLARDYGAYDITFGMGSSPRLWGDYLLVACMTKGPSYVVALDKNTGREIWKTTRRLPAKDDGPDAYSTPVIGRFDGKDAILVSGSDHVDAYDPTSGRQLWVAGGLGIPSKYGRIIASPVAAGDLVIATSGNPGGGGLGHVQAVRVGRSGQGASNGALWKYAKSTPDSSTPVVWKDRVYLVTDQGIATCLDLPTGDVKWQKRLAKGPYHASLVAGEGKIYFLSTEGPCTVLEAGDAGRVLAENRLDGTFYATPAISDSVIYLRSYDRLVAIDGRKRQR